MQVSVLLNVNILTNKQTKTKKCIFLNNFKIQGLYFLIESASQFSFTNVLIVFLSQSVHGLWPEMWFRATVVAFSSQLRKNHHLFQKRENCALRHVKPLKRITFIGEYHSLQCNAVNCTLWPTLLHDHCWTFLLRLQAVMKRSRNQN